MTHVDLQKEQRICPAEVTATAAAWADYLTKQESRCPGDVQNAMQRVARRLGVSASALWRLRYRRPKDIAASIYLKLSAAYERECARQLRLLQHEIEVTQAVAPRAHHLDAAEALVRAERLK